MSDARTPADAFGVRSSAVTDNPADAAPLGPDARQIAPAFLGRTETLLSLYRFLRNPIAALSDVMSRHGPFVVIDPVAGLPRRRIIVAAGAEFNLAVLSVPRVWQTVSLTPRGPAGSALLRLGDNVVSLNGPRHTYYRKLLSQPIRKASVDEMGDDIGRLVSAEVATWSAGSADLWQHARTLMRSVATALLFSGEQAHGAALATLFERLAVKSKSAQVQLFRKAWPGSAYAALIRQAEDIERCALAMAHAKRGDPGQRDLVSLLVNSASETGGRPSDAAIAGHIPVLFAASFETCQTALTWTTFLLAQHPDVARDVADEVSAALAGGEPTLSRIAGLPLLDAVVRESMRILPPVPYQVRLSATDTSLNGLDVAPGCSVILSSFLTNRDPAIYDEPARFKPERWSRIAPSPFEYMVFSGGPRICPGSWFGLAVVKMALAAILSRFRVTVAAGARIDQRVAITMRPSNGMPVVLHPADGRWSATAVKGDIRRIVEMGARTLH